MTTPDQTDQSFLLPKNFEFRAVPSNRFRPEAQPVASLGPLASFTGTFTGHGFNTIFRPQSTQTPTPLPTLVGGDNVLELNLTSETLTFSQSLGAVPNRGMVQGDIFLNGVPYLHTVSDVTDPKNPVGIHVEPGLWMAVGSTTDPAEGQTLVRMASIPHGNTFLAQGTSSTASRPPTIPAVTIKPPGPRVFANLTANNSGTARIPQDLTSFIAAGTITQKMLDDPNTLLRNHIASQKILSTTTISIATGPASPLFGGGVQNVAFLLGDPAAVTNFAPLGPNAQTLSMQA